MPKAISKLFAIGLAFVLLFTLSSIANTQCQYPEAKVNIQFNIINSNNESEFYSGNWAYYNITLTNSGNQPIETVFTITVLNPDGSINGQKKSYPEIIPLHETVYLCPESAIFTNGIEFYQLDTPGTYKFNLTCDLPLTFVTQDDSTNQVVIAPYYMLMSIDVMPSYQRSINQQTSTLYQNLNDYISDLRGQSARNQALAIITVITSFFAILISLYALPKDTEKTRFFVKVLMILAFVFLVTFFVLIILWPN
jgi:hypothetical protein